MTVKRALPVLILAAALGQAAHAQELKRIGLDDSSSLGLVVTTDRAVKVEGTASVRVETKWPTTVCLGEVGALDVEEARLVYAARVKTNLQGSAYLEMWVHVGGGQYFSRGLDNQAQGASDWKPLQTPFFLQKGQKPTKVTLNLVVNGTGTVWVDDIVLSKRPLK